MNCFADENPIDGSEPKVPFREEGRRNPELGGLLATLAGRLEEISELLNSIENSLSIRCEEREAFAQSHVTLNSLTQLSKRLKTDLDSDLGSSLENGDVSE